jgi:hypothetical protein
VIEALEKIERQLMAAHPRTTKRRSRRQRALAVAVAVGSLILVTAASALTVGVPEPSDETPPSPLDAMANGESATLAAKAPDGGRWQLRALRGQEGSLCVEAPPRPSPDTGGVCAGFDALQSAFKSSGAILHVGGPESGEAAGKVHFAIGLVPAEATGVTIVDQVGEEHVANLSGVWAEAKPGDGLAPSGLERATARPGEEPIGTRAFMAILDGPYPTEPPGIGLEVELDDGHTVRSSWPSDHMPN